MDHGDGYVSEEEAPERSGCAGAAVIAAAVLGSMVGLYAITPEGFILLVWAIGWGAVIWVAKKVPGTPESAPPPPPEGGAETAPQVSAVRDTRHPNRWVVTSPSWWMAWEHDNDNDRDGI